VGIGSNSFRSGYGTSMSTGNQRATDASVGANTIRLNRVDGTTLVGYLGNVYNFTNAAFSSLPDDFTFFYNEMSKDKLATTLGSIKTGYYSHDPSSVASPAATNWFMLTNSHTSAVNGRTDQLVLDGPPWVGDKWDNSTIYLRVTHSSSPNGGSFNFTVGKNVGAGLSNAGSANITLGSKDVGETGFKFKDSEAPVNTYPVAGGGGVGGRPLASTINIATEGVQIYFSAGLFATLTAPVGLFFVSVYEKKAGFAVNLLQCEGQSLPEDHINKFKDVAANGNFFKQYFKAIVRRQLAANSKATGKVIIVYQAGTNTNASQGGYSASTSVKAATQRVVDSFKESIKLLNTEWKEAGFNTSNLAHIVMGGPVTSNSFSDELADLVTSPTCDLSTTCSVDHVKSLPRTEYTANSYWDGAGGTGTGSSTAASHLNEDGYVEWAKAIIENLNHYITRTAKVKRR